MLSRSPIPYHGAPLLLGLPRELRDEIYDHTWDFDSSIQVPYKGLFIIAIRYGSNQSWGSPRNARGLPRWITTSKAILEESMESFGRSHVFEIYMDLLRIHRQDENKSKLLLSNVCTLHVKALASRENPPAMLNKGIFEDFVKRIEECSNKLRKFDLDIASNLLSIRTKEDRDGGALMVWPGRCTKVKNWFREEASNTAELREQEGTKRSVELCARQLVRGTDQIDFVVWKEVRFGPRQVEKIVVVTKGD